MAVSGSLLAVKLGGESELSYDAWCEGLRCTARAQLETGHTALLGC